MTYGNRLGPGGIFYAVAASQYFYAQERKKIKAYFCPGPISAHNNGNIHYMNVKAVKPVFHLVTLTLFFSREEAKSECDWVVMSSVFVASQSSCFFFCSREQIRVVENRV